MTVVIDCNIFVMCLTSRSPYHIIYQALVQKKYNLAVSVEILLEYKGNNSGEVRNNNRKNVYSLAKRTSEC